VMVENPLLLLFIVAGLGYVLGQIKVGHTSLGVAAVLFVGLGIGALSPDLKLPEIIYQLGLVLFVYTIGLTSGTSFLAALRRKGWRDNALVAGLISLAAMLTLGFQSLFLLKPTMAVGMFAGSLTNTPALAAVLERLKNTNPALPKTSLDQLLAEPVIGYSVSYPMGVIGTLLAIFLLQKVWKINYAKEAQTQPELAGVNQTLLNQTIRITQPAVCNRPLEELFKLHGWDVLFGRIQHSGEIFLAEGRSRLNLNDLISVIGTEPVLAQVVPALGEPSEKRLELEQSDLDYRRVFVSNPNLVGHTIKDLHLTQQFGALVTRVRRGDQ
jgi:putative transport protein